MACRIQSSDVRAAIQQRAESIQLLVFAAKRYDMDVHWYHVHLYCSACRDIHPKCSQKRKSVGDRAPSVIKDCSPHTCSTQGTRPSLVLYCTHQRKGLEIERWIAERRLYDVWWRELQLILGWSPNQGLGAESCGPYVYSTPCIPLNSWHQMQTASWFVVKRLRSELNNFSTLSMWCFHCSDCRFIVLNWCCTNESVCWSGYPYVAWLKAFGKWTSKGTIPEGG